MILNYNFQHISEDNFHLDFRNRSFMYGDSVFETIILKNGKIRYLEDHLARLEEGLKALDIKLPKQFNKAFVERAIPELAKINKVEENARIKVQVWRKSGGVLVPAEVDGEFIVIVDKLATTSPLKDKESVRIYEGVKLQYSPFSSNKTGNMLPYILAGNYMKKTQADDLVLLNSQDFVTECVYSNLFWISGNTVFTPEIKCGCVAGVMRKQIIRFLTRNSISIEEGAYTKEALLNAEAAFTSNVSGISVIKNIEGKAMHPDHKLVIDLKNYFN